MRNIVPYALFEGAQPSVQMTEVTLSKDNQRIVITLDRMWRIDDVRSPNGVRHIFRRGNVLSSAKIDEWAKSNGFVRNDRQTKKALKGNALIKYHMKRGYF
jgi:hypothetical protein